MNESNPLDESPKLGLLGNGKRLKNILAAAVAVGVTAFTPDKNIAPSHQKSEPTITLESSISSTPEDPSRDSVEQKQAAAEHLGYAFTALLQPEFLSTCTIGDGSNLLSALNPNEPTNFALSVVNQSKRERKTPGGDSVEAYTLMTLVNNPELAKLLSIQNPDQPFGMQFIVQIRRAQDGKITSFQIIADNEQYLLTQQKIDNGKRDEETHQTDDEIRQKSEQVLKAMRTVFKNVPPGDVLPPNTRKTTVESHDADETYRFGASYTDTTSKNPSEIRWSTLGSMTETMTLPKQ